MLNLYVATDVLTDYTSGMIVVAAPDITSIPEILIDSGEFSRSHDSIDGTWELVGHTDGDPRLVAFSYGGA